MQSKSQAQPIAAGPKATGFRFLPASIAQKPRRRLPGAVVIEIDGKDHFYPETASLGGIARALEGKGIDCSGLNRAIDAFVIDGIWGQDAKAA